MITNTSRKEPALPSGDVLQSQIQTFFRDASVWVEDHWVSILAASAIAVAIFFMLHMIRRWGLRLCQGGDGVASWRAIIGRAIAKTGHFFIFITSIRVVTSFANAPAMVATIVGFLFTIAAVFQVAIWLREIIFGAVEHRTTSDDYRGAALNSALGIIRLLVSIVLFAIATVVVLGNLGVNVTGLIAGLGVGGIAIGLAAQGIFADLFAALAIIFDKPFQVGDSIAFSGSKGVVERIGLKSTRIRGPNGEQRIIANRKLLDFELRNNSNRNIRRMTLQLGIAYDSPADKVAQIPEMVREVVEREKMVFNKAWLSDFGPASILFEVEFDSPSPSADEADQGKHRIGLGILKRFQQAGIRFYAPVVYAEVKE